MESCKTEYHRPASLEVIKNAERPPPVTYYRKHDAHDRRPSHVNSSQDRQAVASEQANQRCLSNQRFSQDVGPVCKWSSRGETSHNIFGYPPKPFKGTRQRSICNRKQKTSSHEKDCSSMEERVAKAKQVEDRLVHERKFGEVEKDGTTIKFHHRTYASHHSNVVILCELTKRNRIKNQKQSREKPDPLTHKDFHK
ncbi:unnamed protein product [Darwinula stevensoni]|uniref:Uncharacterized protein n=1 Tax=Darwinula stevensoni TaxID=69355 RepID=A0A7R9ADH9_9CRUS|nr:unnamed protein product [Darwinula stevensoni]CAG0900796.1 unnamed protein product [Darwinula stevensoni]